MTIEEKLKRLETLALAANTLYGEEYTIEQRYFKDAMTPQTVLALIAALKEAITVMSNGANDNAYGIKRALDRIEGALQEIE